MGRLAQDKTTTQKATLGLGGDMDLSDLAEGAFSSVTEAELAVHAAADLSTSVHGLAKVSVVAGEDETSTHQITVTGMTASDTVTAVLVLTTAASIATLAAHAGTLTAAAGKITPGTEVNNTNNQYIVFWTDNS